MKGKPSTGPRNLPRNPPDCTILDRWIFGNFISADELFAKALRSFATCLSKINSLYEKLVSSLDSPITYDESFSVISVAFLLLFLIH